MQTTLEKYMNNIVLCGFMGCGKTTVGKNIERITDRKFIDMDAFIEQKQNMTVSEIFDKYGGNIMNFVCDDSVKTVRAAFENVPDSDTDISTSYYVNTKNGKRLLVYDRRKIIEMDNGTKSYIGMLTDRNSDEYFS